MATIRRDDSLIESFRRGRKEAFDSLYRRHSRGVLGYLRMQAGTAAEDLLQETFWRVLHGLAHYQPQGRFPGWLHTVARNVLTDWRRRPHHEVALDDVDVLSDPHPHFADRHAEREWLRRAISNLPPEQRAVVVLREYGDMSFAEIARATRAPLGTVLNRMFRALRKLRSLLEADAITAG